MIGHCAGDGIRRFDNIKAYVAPHSLTVAEVPAVGDLVGVAPQEIAVEREDALERCDVVLRNQLRSEGDFRAFQRLGDVNRFVGVPGRFRQRGFDVFADQSQRRRRNLVGENGEPFSAVLGEALGQRPREAVERVPALRRVLLHHAGILLRHHSVGTVEIHDRGLGIRIGRALTRRVPRIAFDLGRPAVVALDENGERTTGTRQTGGIERRLARRNVADLVVRYGGIGEDFEIGPPTARQSRQSQCRGQCEETSPVQRGCLRVIVLRDRFAMTFMDIRESRELRACGNPPIV